MHVCVHVFAHSHTHMNAMMFVTWLDVLMPVTIAGHITHINPVVDRAWRDPTCYLVTVTFSGARRMPPAITRHAKHTRSH